MCACVISSDDLGQDQSSTINQCLLWTMFLKYLISYDEEAVEEEEKKGEK